MFHCAHVIVCDSYLISGNFRLVTNLERDLFILPLIHEPSVPSATSASVPAELAYNMYTRVAVNIECTCIASLATLAI